MIFYDYDYDLYDHFPVVGPQLGHKAVQGLKR